MKAVYHHHTAKGHCPVRKFFNQYTDTRGKKILTDIDAKIKHLVSLNGISKNLAKPLTGYSFLQLGIRKTKDILIRINFIRYRDLLVLLHAFEKPSNYDNAKVKKEVDKEYEIAEQHRLNFISNPQSYEEY